MANNASGGYVCILFDLDGIICFEETCKIRRRDHSDSESESETESDENTAPQDFLQPGRGVSAPYEVQDLDEEGFYLKKTEYFHAWVISEIMEGKN